MEALLGAANLGDKGRLFPPSDPAYRDIRSTLLLGRVVEAIVQNGFEIANVDVSVMCEEPRISTYVEKMQDVLSRVLKITPSQVSVKGTTLERMGFTGRKEGIAALAVALIQGRESR
jgi:2-C-methyl-D-erythritol 2,4-cyclodiphosphate synthase